MNILMSCLVLDRSGTPTFTQTLYNELVRRGHQVLVYSPHGGALACDMNTVSTLAGVDPPDVLFGQMNVCALELHAAFPSRPLIFMSHGTTPVTETPPGCRVDWYVAINEDVRDHLITHGAPADRITIIRDFVDLTRFRQMSPVRPRLEHALYISNYKKWRTFALITRACKELDISLKCIGSPYGRSRVVEVDINQSDLVISAGRGILEAMACARPVIVLEQMRGDGYLTADVYADSRMHNFFGAKCRHFYSSVTMLVQELQKYRPEDGQVNRCIAERFHGHVAGTDQVLEVMNKVLA